MIAAWTTITLIAFAFLVYVLIVAWIVPWHEKRMRSAPNTCYVADPCGTCRACKRSGSDGSDAAKTVNLRR